MTFIKVSLKVGVAIRISIGRRHVKKLIRFTIKTFLLPPFYICFVFASRLHGSDGAASCPSPGLGQGLLVEVGTLVAPGKVGLHLAVLCKVERSDLLSLLDLLLVGLDLALQLVNQALHSLVVLPVLIHLVGVLLDGPFRPPQILLGITAAPGLCVHLRLKLTDASLHLGHRLLAALQGILLSLIDPSLG